MKRFCTFLLLGLPLWIGAAQAQEIDESFVFMDEDGELIENGATIIRTVAEPLDDEVSVVNAGIYVLNLEGSTDYLKMIYDIKRMDNGYYQICFPSNCNSQEAVGSYETAIGLLDSDLQDIQSEWFSYGDGECTVTLTLELFTKEGLFPPTYIHKAYGPTITIRFIQGDTPDPGKEGDVNGDGEVNIADVNAVIDMILTQNIDKSGDVNHDSEVNIADVNSLIDLILNN